MKSKNKVNTVPANFIKIKKIKLNENEMDFLKQTEVKKLQSNVVYTSNCFHPISRIINIK
jgi:hypothetical protein